MHVCVLLLAHLAPTLAAPNLLFVTDTGATNDVLTTARKVNTEQRGQIIAQFALDIKLSTPYVRRTWPRPPRTHSPGPRSQGSVPTKTFETVAAALVAVPVQIHYAPDVQGGFLLLFCGVVRWFTNRIDTSASGKRRN